MTTTGAFLTRHQVAAYFVLTFIISWGCVLLVIGGPGRILGTATAQGSPLFPLVFLAMLAGPETDAIALQPPAAVVRAGVVAGNSQPRGTVSTGRSA